MSRVRILIADSNQDIRESMRQVVEATCADVSLALAGDGQDAINLALSLRPHLAMIDIGLHKVDVLTTIRYLRRRVPEMRIIVMLTDDNKEYRLAAQRAGACAVVAKASLNEDWMRTIICLLQDCPGVLDGKPATLPEFDNCDLR